MGEQVVSADKRLDVLHDHYKETFARQRELERSRDRSFLWVILLFAVLCVEIGYPAEFTGSVQTISLLGTEIDLAKLPPGSPPERHVGTDIRRNAAILPNVNLDRQTVFLRP